jgi:hypothetical protein
MKRFPLLIVIGFLIMTAGIASAEGDSLMQKYQVGGPVKILIIPGHDNEFSGTEFRGMREADLNIRMADELAKELRKDGTLQVVVSRDTKTGNYIPELLSYFESQKDAVASFTAEHKASYKKMKEDVAAQTAASPTTASPSTAVPKKEVPHAPANAAVAYRLYAVNKWAGEQAFDLIINVHFNDHYPRSENKVGDYTGYTIYTPGDLLPNAHPSREVSKAIGDRLIDILPRSNLFLESNVADESGAILDTSLIALGSNATLTVPSILIEYSYIYESQLRPEVSSMALRSMARATKLGLEDYLSGKKEEAKTFTHDWKQNLLPGSVRSREVLALQIGLRYLTFYPLLNKKGKPCNLDGIYGECTKAGLSAFQKSNKLTTDGLFGKKTRTLMNSIFKD